LPLWHTACQQLGYELGEFVVPPHLGFHVHRAPAHHRSFDGVDISPCGQALRLRGELLCGDGELIAPATHPARERVEIVARACEGQRHTQWIGSRGQVLDC
jgi:hypothetical protein